MATMAALKLRKKDIIEFFYGNIENQAKCDYATKKRILNVIIWKIFNISLYPVSFATVKQKFQANLFKSLGYRKVSITYGSGKQSRFYVVDKLP